MGPNQPHAHIRQFILLGSLLLILIIIPVTTYFISKRTSLADLRNKAATSDLPACPDVLCDDEQQIYDLCVCPTLTGTPIPDSSSSPTPTIICSGECEEGQIMLNDPPLCSCVTPTPTVQITLTTTPCPTAPTCDGNVVEGMCTSVPCCPVYQCITNTPTPTQIPNSPTLTIPNTPTPTVDTRPAWCSRIKTYKNGQEVTPSSLNPGDAIVIAVVHQNGEKAQISINNGAYIETNTKNGSGEFVLDYTLDSTGTHLKITAQVYKNGIWQ